MKYEECLLEQAKKSNLSWFLKLNARNIEYILGKIIKLAIHSLIYTEGCKVKQLYKICSTKFKQIIDSKTLITKLATNT